jgi:hypothetical protein
MLQAIPLPPFSVQAKAMIGDPNEPSNPPSVMDITNAMHYSRILLNANGIMSGISLMCAVGLNIVTQPRKGFQVKMWSIANSTRTDYYSLMTVRVNASDHALKLCSNN